MSKTRKVGRKTVYLRFDARNGAGATCLLFVRVLRDSKADVNDVSQSVGRRSLARCLDAIHRGPVGRELTTSDSAWLEKELGL